MIKNLLKELEQTNTVIPALSDTIFKKLMISKKMALFIYTKDLILSQ